MTVAAMKLDRITLRTSRLLDFCSRKELIAQTGAIAPMSGSW